MGLIIGMNVWLGNNPKPHKDNSESIQPLKSPRYCNNWYSMNKKERQITELVVSTYRNQANLTLTVGEQVQFQSKNRGGLVLDVVTCHFYVADEAALLPGLDTSSLSACSASSTDASGAVIVSPTIYNCRLAASQPPKPQYDTQCPSERQCVPPPN